MDSSKLHIVAVTGVLEKDGKILVLKRSAKEIAFPGKWTLPGGKVEKGDSVSKTLKKEFEEETGIKIKDEIKFLTEGEFTRPDGYHVVLLKFICQYDSGEVKLEEESFDDWTWMDLDEIDKFDLIDGIREDLKKYKNGSYQQVLV